MTLPQIKGCFSVLDFASLPQVSGEITSTNRSLRLQVGDAYCIWRVLVVNVGICRQLWQVLRLNGAFQDGSIFSPPGDACSFCFRPFPQSTPPNSRGGGGRMGLASPLKAAPPPMFVASRFVSNHSLFKAFRARSPTPEVHLAGQNPTRTREHPSQSNQNWKPKMAVNSPTPKWYHWF